MATIQDNKIKVLEAGIPDTTIRFFEIGNDILARMEDQPAAKFAEKMAGAWVMATTPIVQMVDEPNNPAGAQADD